MTDILDLDLQHDESCIESESESDNASERAERAKRAASLESVKREVKSRKGRGFNKDSLPPRRQSEMKHGFEGLATSIPESASVLAQRSVEGWIVLVTGVHEEAREDDIVQTFGEKGNIKNCHLNLDRRTGYLKGYALIEYENFKEARDAIDALDGTLLLGQAITVDWAFTTKPLNPNPPGRSTRRRDRELY